MLVVIYPFHFYVRKIIIISMLLEAQNLVDLNFYNY